MPLKAGDWRINIFGMEGNLTINASSNGEFINGQLSNFTHGDLNGYLIGLFDETSQQIKFGVQSDPSLYTHTGPAGGITPTYTSSPNFMRGLMFKGCLFATPRAAQPGQDITWNLAGTLEVSDLGILGMVFQSNSRRTTFGWTAQLTDTQ